ncbi:MAG: IPTL-CTERM sorting domain-containing protein [Planctomycetota bacterium]
MLSFGDGQTDSTYQLSFGRGRDVPSTNNSYAVELLRYDPDLATQTSLGWVRRDVSTVDDTLYLRLVRSGGLLTAMWSTDGTSWETPLSIDLGNQLDGLEQRLILSGSCWFNTVGSYADHDYVRVEGTGACCLTGGACQELVQGECTAQSGVFHGSGSSCGADFDGDTIADVCDPCPFDPTNTMVDGKCIPTLSEWGMMAMAALILSAGGVVIARRRAAG